MDEGGEEVDGCAGWRGRNVGGRYGDSQCYEASLIVPDFTISVYSSSCNYLFFGLILAPFLSPSLCWCSQCNLICQ